MGVSIYAGVYNMTDLVRIVEELVPDAVDVQEMLEAIIPEFGAFVSGPEFVLVYNEYYGGYNPKCEFFRFITRYYGIEDGELWMYDYSVPGGANSDEIAYRFGIKLIEDEEEW